MNHSNAMTHSQQIDFNDTEDIRRATAARLANPQAQPDAADRRHIYVADCLRGGPVSKYCTCYHCTLYVCSVCGAYEGGLTTHCPGEHVDADTTLAVYRTTLDYTTKRGWHLSGDGMGRRSTLFAPDEIGGGP